MWVLGLDHVQLAAPAGCEPAARRFFGELLGLEELSKPAALASRGGVWFSLGEQQLHIGVEREFAPARKAHPAFRVDSQRLDPLAERLRAEGAEVEWAPEGRRFFTQDPWGNRIELTARGPG